MIILMLPVTCFADQAYKDAYVHNYTEGSFSVSSTKLTTLCKSVFSLSEAAAFQDMLVLINMVVPDHDYTIVIENSSLARLDVYKAKLSTSLIHQSTCDFCDIIKGVGEGIILNSNQQAIALKKPYITPTFLLVPKTHIENVKAVCLGCINYSRLLVSMLELAYKQAGNQAYRLVSNNGGGSSQTVFHMHWHITPLSFYQM